MDHHEQYSDGNDAPSSLEAPVEVMALLSSREEDGESPTTSTAKKNYVPTRKYKYPFCFLLCALLTLSVVVILSSSTRQRTAGNMAKSRLQQQQHDPRNNEMVPFQYPDRIPEIAWMMSFGGSGTSYTILNTEQMSRRSTASNYGGDFQPCLAVHPDSPNGPYIRSPHKGLPINSNNNNYNNNRTTSSWILTKTHCGGFCMDCPPAAYVLDALQFQQACFAGRRRWPNGTTELVSYYNATTTHVVRPTRAVHLIRHPFDNIVGRMHLGIKHQEQREKNQQELVLFMLPKNNDDPQETLLQWCEYLDRKYRDRERQAFSEEYMNQYGDIPCHAEWYRYIQWHNLATAVTTEQLQIPVHYLWYDNYTTNFDETVAQLFDFVNLKMDPPDATPYEWQGAGKTYVRDLPPTLQTQAARMMRDLATPAAWKLIQHYLDPFLSE